MAARRVIPEAAGKRHKKLPIIGIVEEWLTQASHGHFIRYLHEGLPGLMS
jgi:hypothetical protein